jgi:hypothetical protein
MDFSSSSFYRSFIRMPIWVMEKLARSTGRSRSFLAAEAKFVYGFAKSDQGNIRG